METTVSAARREPWNKGKIVGQKAPFKLKDIWALRVRLQITPSGAPEPGGRDFATRIVPLLRCFAIVSLVGCVPPRRPVCG